MRQPQETSNINYLSHTLSKRKTKATEHTNIGFSFPKSQETFKGLVFVLHQRSLASWRGFTTLLQMNPRQPQHTLIGFLGLWLRLWSRDFFFVRNRDSHAKDLTAGAGTRCMSLLPTSPHLQHQRIKSHLATASFA